MSLDTTVKTIQDIMRKDAGVDGDAQRISQLGWMLFLKIFDAREEEYELEDENYCIDSKLLAYFYTIIPPGILSISSTLYFHLNNTDSSLSKFMY